MLARTRAEPGPDVIVEPRRRSQHDVDRPMTSIAKNPAGGLREPTGPLADLGTKTGVLPRQRIRALIRRRMIQAAADVEDSQLQPASLDLRLGTRAYRVPASFLPGRDKTV